MVMRLGFGGMGGWDCTAPEGIALCRIPVRRRTDDTNTLVKSLEVQKAPFWPKLSEVTLG
jgi:hypothetical protein